MSFLHASIIYVYTVLPLVVVGLTAAIWYKSYVDTYL